MTDQGVPPELVQLLDIDRQVIHETYPYVYYLTKAPPGSETPWPADLRPYDYAELRARLSGMKQLPPPNPYSEYDAWLEAHCGPNGYDRIGSTVGFRDRTAAEAFLRWIFPELSSSSSSAAYDMKHHLTRMMVKAVPNDDLAAEILNTIGGDIVSRIDPESLAYLSDRIYTRDLRESQRDVLASESEVLALKAMGLFPPAKHDLEVE